MKSVTIGGYDSPVYKNQSSAKAKAKAELDVAALDFMEGIAFLSRYSTSCMWNTYEGQKCRLAF